MLYLKHRVKLVQSYTLNLYFCFGLCYYFKQNGIFSSNNLPKVIELSLKKKKKRDLNKLYNAQRSMHTEFEFRFQIIHFLTGRN